MKILFSSLFVLSSFGYIENPNITIDEIKKAVSTKDTEIVYSILSNKGFKLNDYELSEYYSKEWTYSYGYSAYDDTAQIWIFYETNDFEKKLDVYEWEKGWFLKDQGSIITPQPSIDPVTSLEIVWYNNVAYDKLTKFIKANFQKIEAKYSEFYHTYTYLYKSGPYEFYFYTNGKRYYLESRYVDPEILKKVNDLWDNDVELSKEYRKKIRTEYDKDGYTACDCKDIFSDLKSSDELYWYCWSHIDEKIKPDGGTTYSYSDIDSLFNAPCNK